ncbi:hypothetical protein A6B40_07965 [Mannheimia varigena]|nr:hypothetical protein A6B40_07965 [Mannheimia varigena]
MKISIIVPIYNVENYLETCLESLVNQTYQNIDIILVNDGSTDNSRFICEKYAKQYDFVSLINKENSGVSEARNTGILATKSELVMFVDSDDYVSHNFCEKLIYNYNGEDLVFCDYMTFEENRMGYKKFIANEKDLLDDEDSFSLLSELGNSHFEKMYKRLFFNSPCCKIYKRSKIHSLFKSNINLGEDLLFNLNYLTTCTSIKGMNDKLYFYRIGNQSSLSRRFDETRLCNITYVFNRSITLFNTIFKDNYEKDIVKLKYLEEYALSIKKMLSHASFSYKEKLQRLVDYRARYPIEREIILCVPKLALQYRLFLSLYLNKQDYLLLLLTEVFNLIKK